MPLRHFEAAVDIFLSTWIVTHLGLKTLQQAVQCHAYVCLYKVALHFGLDNNHKWFHKVCCRYYPFLTNKINLLVHVMTCQCIQ